MSKKTIPLELFIKDGNQPIEPQVAQALINPAIQAANTIRATIADASDDLRTSDLFKALEQRSKLIKNGDSSTAQEHLASQAITLGAISNDLMRRALVSDQVYLIEDYMKLALKAQAQARQTWESLSAIQNPPLAHYVGQQNVAYNQQVNNNSKEKLENPPNELLEKDHGQRLDTRKKSKAGRDDQAVEAVGELHRAED